MSGKCILLLMLGMTVLLCAHSNAAAANVDQGTKLRIYEPTAIPGQSVLLPGIYVIKRLPTAGQVVQILNESQTKVYATLFAHDFESVLASQTARRK